MRKILSMGMLLLSLLAVTSVMAQDKQKVAIYMVPTEGDNPKMPQYTKLLATELQIAISRSAEYHAVERTGKFLELLSQEQNYQRGGAVDDSKIAELGKQEGVDYVLSVDLTDFGDNTVYAVWKLINVETAIVKDGDTQLQKIVNVVNDLKALSSKLTKRIVSGGSGQQNKAQDFFSNLFKPNQKSEEKSEPVEVLSVLELPNVDFLVASEDEMANGAYITWVEANKRCDMRKEGWRLPTKQEVYVMYMYRDILKLRPNASYWTAECPSSTTAFYYNMELGQFGKDGQKAKNICCRLVKSK